ncbi:MAG: hypothetical protein Q7V63_05055 [Gammaproteobacteria bacterium]|nr:hypothetical protein [Gammaproteobacteria bacterium]
MPKHHRPHVNLYRLISFLPKALMGLLAIAATISYGAEEEPSDERRLLTAVGELIDDLAWIPDYSMSMPDHSIAKADDFIEVKTSAFPVTAATQLTVGPRIFDQKETDAARVSYNRDWAGLLTPDQLNAWLDSHIVGKSIDLSQVNIFNPEAFKIYGFSNIVEKILHLADEERFKRFVDADLIDWMDPKFAFARASLLLRRNIVSIKYLYDWVKSHTGENIFYLKDNLNIRSIDWLLAQGNIADDPLTLGFLEKLTEVGIINLAYEVKVDPEIRHSISASNNSEIVKAYLPKASDPLYQDVVYDITLHAIFKQRWNIVAACLDLPELDLNIQKGHYQGKTYLMALVEANQFDLAERLLSSTMLNLNLRDNSGKTAVHYIAIVSNRKDESGLRAKSLLKNLATEQPIFLVPTKYYPRGPLSFIESVDAELRSLELKGLAGQASAIKAFDTKYADLIGPFNAIGTDSLKDMNAKGKVFQGWWKKNKDLLKYGVGDINFFGIFVNYCSRQAFGDLLALDYIPLESPDFSSIRKNLLIRAAGTYQAEVEEKAEMLVAWGRRRFEINIFSMPHNGKTLIRDALEQIYSRRNKLGFNLHAAMTDYIRLHNKGIIDIRAEFKTDKPVEEILASLESLHEALFGKTSALENITSEQKTLSQWPSKINFLYILIVTVTLYLNFSSIKRMIEALIKMITGNPLVPASAIAEARILPLRLPQPVLSDEEIARRDALALLERESLYWREQLSVAQTKLTNAQEKFAKLETIINTQGIDADLAEASVKARASYAIYLEAQHTFIVCINDVSTALNAAITVNTADNITNKDTAIVQAQAANTALTISTKIAQDDLSVADELKRQFDKAERDRRLTEDLRIQNEAKRADRERAAEAHAAKSQVAGSIKQQFQGKIDKLNQIKTQELSIFEKLREMKKIYDEADRLPLPLGDKNPKLGPVSKVIEALEKQAGKLRSDFKAESEKALLSSTNKAQTIAFRLASLEKLYNSWQGNGASDTEIKAGLHTLGARIEELNIEKQSYEKHIDTSQAAMDILLADKAFTVADKYSGATKLFNEAKASYNQLNRKPDELWFSLDETLERVTKNYHDEGAKPREVLPVTTALQSLPKAAFKNLSADIDEKCLRIKAQLNADSLNKQLPDDIDLEAYLEQHQAMAISYNLARLFDCLSTEEAIFIRLRNHVLHRSHQAQSDKAVLLTLAEKFSEESYVHALVKSIRKGESSFINEIKESEYYKRYCNVPGVKYSIELREPRFGEALPKEIVDELKEALTVLQEFMGEFMKSNRGGVSDKPIDLFASTHSMHADHVRMGLNILKDRFIGRYHNQLKSFLSDNGVSAAELIQLNSFIRGRLSSIRNETMHGASVDSDGGMSAIVEKMDGIAIKHFYRSLGPMINAFMVYNAKHESKVEVGLATPFAGAGKPSMPVLNAVAKGLSASAKEWTPH